jgi:hypothetical protein
MSDLFALPPDRPLPRVRRTAARSQLVETTSKRSLRFPGRWQHTGIVVGVGVGLSVGGGVALAHGVFSQAPLPGSPSEAHLAKPVVATRTGTATINLGPVPRKANAISLTLTGLSVGTFHFPGTASMSCSQSDISDPGPEGCGSYEVIPLLAGQHTVTITTSANVSWKLRAIYVHQVITAWKVNAHGQTYGVANKNGFPDLVAVDQGGQSGYVKSSDFNCFGPPNGDNVAIPIYKSNGTTRIGTFIRGNANPSTPTVPVSSLHCAVEGTSENPVPQPSQPANSDSPPNP